MANVTELLIVVSVLGSLVVAFVAGVTRPWAGFFTWWGTALLCSPPVALLGLGVMVLHTIARRIERIEDGLRNDPPRNAAAPSSPAAPREPGRRGSDMPKLKRKARGRVAKMSPLIIARIEAEVLTLAAELKARDPGMTPAKLQALGKWLRRSMRGLIR